MGALYHTVGLGKGRWVFITFSAQSCPLAIRLVHLPLSHPLPPPPFFVLALPTFPPSLALHPFFPSVLWSPCLSLPPAFLPPNTSLPYSPILWGSNSTSFLAYPTFLSLKTPQSSLKQPKVPCRFDYNINCLKILQCFSQMRWNAWTCGKRNGRA